MSIYIKEIFRLNNKQLKLLLKALPEKIIMEQRKHFKVRPDGIMQPVTVWRLFYYIDIHGDFINEGKLRHHKIARAIYNSMSSRRKLEILEYIDG